MFAPFMQARRAFVALAAGTVSVFCAANAWTQNTAVIGEIEQSRGVGFVQTPGQGPRILSRGAKLSEGDRLTTAADSLAILKLSDGTKMTIRPNSEMVLTEFKYKADANDNSFVMDLLRGGFRAITGLVNKNAPNAARIKTSTATIGIRGTDFDARLCQGGECMAQAGNRASAPMAAQLAASAKFLQTRGNLQVLDAKGQRRAAVDGSAIYPGETVETAANAQGVLVFRDESKVALGASTRFKVDNFVFDAKAPSEGSYIVTLLRGSLRAVTGLIGKANVRNVRYATSTATIGIRGTEFGLTCEGACAGEVTGNPSQGLVLFTFDGSVVITPVSDGLLREVAAGGGMLVTPAGVLALTQLPPNFTVPSSPTPIVIPPSLFLQSNVPEGQDGLFVFVRDGHIEIERAGQVLHLGIGETGVSNEQGLNRPIFTPTLITGDNVPLPNSRLPSLILTPPRPSSLPQCPRV